MIAWQGLVFQFRPCASASQCLKVTQLSLLQHLEKAPEPMLQHFRKNATVFSVFSGIFFLFDNWHLFDNSDLSSRAKANIARKLSCLRSHPLALLSEASSLVPICEVPTSETGGQRVENCGKNRRLEIHVPQSWQ